METDKLIKSIEAQDPMRRNSATVVVFILFTICLCSNSTNGKSVTASGFSMTLDQIEVCAGRQYEILEILKEIRDPLRWFISTAGLGSKIDAATIDNLLDIKHLSAIKREVMGDSLLVTYRYIEPYDGLYLGSTAGIDVVFSPCAWEIRDVALWEVDDQ